MKKIKLENIGETFEHHYHEVIARSIYHMVKGFFHFKKHKGELFAASGTFFSLLSLPPLILLLISAIYYFTGSIEGAQQQVLSSIKHSFPNMAPWIFQSIEKLIQGQLNTSTRLNWMNILMLLYSGTGVVAAVMYGLNRMAERIPRGGFIFDNLRSFFATIMMTTFFISMILLTQEHVITTLFGNSQSMTAHVFTFIYHSTLFLPLIATGFFTLFFKVATGKHISFKRSLLGAFSFVITFSAGRTFYWVYLHYAQQNLEMSFGNFYTIIVVVLWTYFAQCSLFYGASVAYQPYERDMGVHKLFKNQQTSTSQKTIPIPTDQEAA